MLSVVACFGRYIRTSNCTRLAPRAVGLLLRGDHDCANGGRTRERRGASLLPCRGLRTLKCTLPPPIPSSESVVPGLSAPGPVPRFSAGLPAPQLPRARSRASASRRFHWKWPAPFRASGTLRLALAGRRPGRARRWQVRPPPAEGQAPDLGSEAAPAATRGTMLQ